MFVSFNLFFGYVGCQDYFNKIHFAILDPPYKTTMKGLD